MGLLLGPVGLPLPVAVPLRPLAVVTAAVLGAPVAIPVRLLPLTEGRARLREKVRLHLVPETVLLEGREIGLEEIYNELNLV